MNFRKSFTKSQLNRFLAFSISYLAIGTVVFHWLEKFSWIDSLYYVVVTLATVGYGDLAPKTTAGRLFAVFYIIIGIGIFVGFAKIMLSRVVMRRQKRLKATKKKQAKQRNTR